MRLIKNIILFSSSLGQQKYGIQNTPNYLRNFIENTNSDASIYDSNIDNKNLFSSLKNLYDVNSKNNYIPKLNIGGDHSMAIATVADSLNRCPNNLKVIWIDAHPDINTYNSSISKNIHGMPLAYLTGLDSNSNFDFIKNYLSFENLLYIGIRDIDEYEQKIIDKYSIKYISVHEFNSDFEKSIKKIKNFVSGCPIHISFDVDSIEPSKMPCTGTTSNDGLLVNNLFLLFRELYEHNIIINTDITELNLELGTTNDKVKSLCNLMYIFSGILF